MKKTTLKTLVAILAALLCFSVFVSAEEPVPDTVISVKEDAYVLNKNGDGDMTGRNFGTEADMQLKSNNGSLTRYAFVKFDISSLAEKSDFTCVDLDLFCTFRQNDADTPAKCTVGAYGCSNDWRESGVTFASQPEIYGLAGYNKEITNTREYFSISITDYVRQALAKGEKEISLYLKDDTAEKPTHFKFSTKEGASEKAPKLSVYYGTKTDDMKYNEKVQQEEPVNPQEPTVAPNTPPELSKDGLDAIFGHKLSQSLTLDVKEDVHVEGGQSANKNFDTSTHLDFKAMAGETPTNYYRVVLLKFDISDIKGGSVTSATLTLNCTLMEDKTIPTTVHVYGCNPQNWNEQTVTFNTAPEKEELVATGVVSSTGEISFSVTDYVNRCLGFGDVEVAFILDGDADSVRRLYFAPKETENGAKLNVTFGDSAYTTNLKFNGENPWQVAMENYSDWYHRWEIIKQGGDTDVEVIEKIDEEYPLVTDATYGSETDGYNTRYRQFNTRLISTLKGYTESTAEVELYDEYGGYMGGERYEATGYFYTKKIGDRWWTIDPLGYPYYRVACVTIGLGSSIQTQNAKEKYGSEANWAQAATDRLYELGFNSAGGWSAIDKLSKVDNPLSQTKVLYLLRDYAKTLSLDIGKSGHTEFHAGVMPVFDPEFATFAKENAKADTKGYAGKSYVYGWFSDNELPASIRMLDNTLTLDPTDERFSYSYANAWTFMYMKTGKEDVTLNDVTDELRKEYRAMVYDKYLRVSKDALERCVPMHQYIGSRFVTDAFKDEYVMRVSGYYCDVITLNYYSVWQADPELLANMQKWSGRAFAITEWYAKGMDVWEKDNRITNKSGAGWTVRTQTDRGHFYQNYALQLLECKGCVGFDWFQYIDNDPDNLGADLSNRDSNKGIVNTEHEEYTELTAIMEQLNKQKYNLVKFFDER